MPSDTTVTEVKPETPSFPTTPAAWLAYATGKWGIGGACVALAVAGLCYVYGDLRDTTRQMVLDQKEANTATRELAVEATQAIGASTDTMERVGEAVESNSRATAEIARDVRELREEFRREK